MEASPYGRRFPVMGGVYELKEIGFRLVIWSTRELEAGEVEAAYREWRAKEKRGEVVPGKTFHYAYAVAEGGMS
ncbi:MAG: hypothetical protein ACKV19_03465 [Verrucomicrobiales bacterium]